MNKTQPSSINLLPPDRAWPPDAPYPHAAQASSARGALDSLLNRTRLRSFPNPASETPALHSASSRSPISHLRSPAQSASVLRPPRLRASAGNPSTPRSPISHLLSSERRCAAFSLIEMMVVIAIIAILTTLAVPAFKGLVGVSGMRGGTDAILGALSVAQSRALESGTNTYIAFPPSSFSRFIILQSEVTNILSGNTSHTLTNPVVLTPRWLKLPTGVQLTFSNTNGLFTNLDFSASTNLPSEVAAMRRNLPPLDGSNAFTRVRAIPYNRFGSLPTSIATNLQLIVGEGFSDGINPIPTFTGPTNTRAIFTAHQLVGKWIPATNN